MGDEREIHVERAVIWNVVITDEFGPHLWPHESETEAVERADRMFRNKLATKRGEDKL